MATQDTAQNGTIVNSVVGGIILGAAVSLYLVLVGRRVNPFESLCKIFFWRTNYFASAFALFAGFFIAAGIFFDWIGYNNYSGSIPYGKKQNITAHISAAGFAISGLLMGFGGGILSGAVFSHAYYGVPRLIPRYILATFIFIVFGMIGSLASRSIQFLSDDKASVHIDVNHVITANVFIGIGVILLIIALYQSNQSMFGSGYSIKHTFALFFASLFSAFGMLVGGAFNRTTVKRGFAIGSSEFNPNFLIFFVVTIIICLSIQLITDKLRNNPSVSEQLFVLQDRRYNIQLFLGSTLFGLGWGISGVDPAAYIGHWAIFTLPVCVIYGFCLLLGAHLGNMLIEKNVFE